VDDNNNNNKRWRTDGNNVDANDWLGTRNNAPLIIRTENGGGVPNPGAEAMRITAAADGRRVGIGTGSATPTQKLTLGSGNCLLRDANFGNDGNLYFGGITDAGQTGMRLFGGLVNGAIPAGFIDVRTTDANDGLRVRVDTSVGGTERMRITAGGNVGIGTTTPGARLSVNGDVEVTGDIRLLGADCAENFDVSEAEAAEPGTVMVIDQEGTLKPSEQAYDKRVAGVVSGAEGYKPGIVLDGQKSEAARMPVALIGKVACKVDARHSPIEVGDLLTSSSTSGHAMKADDPLRAFGAVIGKALHSLKGGQDIIPVLIALQ
jgi:hypothetical protein